MKEFEITLRVCVEADTMESAEECAEAIIAELLSDRETSVTKPETKPSMPPNLTIKEDGSVIMAEWDKISPRRTCLRINRISCTKRMKKPTRKLSM